LKDKSIPEDLVQIQQLSNTMEVNWTERVFYLSSLIFWILSILIIDSWDITIRISFHGNFILEKVALMLKIDTKNKCLSWDNIYYWINSVNSTSFSKIFYMPFFFSLLISLYRYLKKKFFSRQMRWKILF
jgi:hypothetical protein